MIVYWVNDVKFWITWRKFKIIGKKFTHGRRKKKIINANKTRRYLHYTIDSHNELDHIGKYSIFLKKKEIKSINFFLFFSSKYFFQNFLHFSGNWKSEWISSLVFAWLWFFLKISVRKSWNILLILKNIECYQWIFNSSEYINLFD